MCTSSQDPLSKIARATVGDTIEGEDELTHTHVIIEFHDAGDNVATCVGNQSNLTRHFHLPQDDYEDMKAVIRKGLKIQIRGLQGPPNRFTRVDWEGVAS